MYEDNERKLDAVTKQAPAVRVVEPSVDDNSVSLSWRVKAAVVALLVVVALVSALPLRAIFTSPDTYAATIATIDEKKTTVLGLTAAAAGASAAISAIPDDVGTPIADKLMDLCSSFTIVLVALYLEKY